MAILEREVIITLGGKNIKYYENKGYTLERYINKYGKSVVLIGSELIVKVEDLPSGSEVRLTKICDICGVHCHNITYYQITKSRISGDGKDRCFSCGKDKAREKLLNSIDYENSLEKYALDKNKLYLLREYSDKNPKSPDKISYASGQPYLWNCSTCQSEYKAYAYNRTNQDTACPFCKGFQVNHTNCLWTLKPEIAKLLKDEDLGYKLTIGSNKTAIFVCPNCNLEQSKIINAVSKLDYFPCSKCSDGISYSEKFMAALLDQTSQIFEREKTFKWSQNKRYDFYLPNKNCIIETHGIQHYSKVQRFHFHKTFEEEISNDNFKMYNALNNGIDLYIVIDCSLSDKDFLKKSITESDMLKLLNIEKVDWDLCHEFATNTNLLKTISDIWTNKTKNVNEIAKFVKLERSTVVRKLKKCSDLGLCTYDPKVAQRESGLKSGHSGKIEVVQLSMDGKLIKLWESAMDARRELNIYNIAYACKGRYISAGGFKWKYADDYFVNEYLNDTKKIVEVP